LSKVTMTATLSKAQAHEKLPIQFWEEIYSLYTRYNNSELSVDDCFNLQRSLYNSEMEKIQKSEEKSKKTSEKYKKLDSLFEQIKSKTEKQKIENSMKNKTTNKSVTTKKDAKQVLSETNKEQKDVNSIEVLLAKLVESWSFFKNDSYTCGECNEKQNALKLFERHVKRKHDHYKPFTCHICDYSARSKQSVTDHMKTKHASVAKNMDKERRKESTKKVQENSSPDTIVTKKMEKLWENTKEGSNGVYDCDACKKDDKSFTCLQSHTFEEHILKNHSGYKPFPCNVCDFKTNKKMKLRNHVRKYHYETMIKK